MESLLSIIARNSFYSTLGKLGVKLGSFAFTIFVVRWLGDEGYGQYTLIWSYIIVFAMLSDAGLSLYAIREVAKRKPGSQYLIANIIAIRMVLAAVTIALMMILMQLTGYSNLFAWQVFLAGVILFVYAVQDPLDAFLQAHERFDLVTISLAMGQIVFIGVGAAALIVGWHITGLIVAGLLNVSVSAGLAWRFTAGYRNRLRWTLKPRLWSMFLRESLFFGLIKLWLSWWLKIDIIILSWFWLDEMVGWYGAAYAIILGITIISNSVNSVLYPTLSRQYTQNPASISPLYELALKYLLTISLPLAGGIFLTAKPVINILYGAEFSPAAVVLELLIWVVPLMFASEFLRYALLTTNREKSAVRILGLVLLFSIGLNLWLVPLYGFLGAAGVAVIAEAVLILLYSRPLRAELRVINLTNAVLKPIVATLMMMAIVQMSSPLQLVGQVGLGGLAYFLSISLLGVVKLNEYKLLFSLLKKPRINRLPALLNQTPQSQTIETSPLISVFIPTYNTGRFIRQAVESVLNQTYQNYELIIVDDHSTDDTLQILEQYRSDPRVTIYRNPKNVGMAANWNTGLRLCRGEFIAKLDADDFYEVDYLQTVIDFMQNNPAVGLVFSGLNLIYPDNRREPEMMFFKSWVRDRKTFLPDLLEMCMIRSPTVCVRRACYQKLGGFIEEMQIHADWEMWVKIAAHYPVGFIARILANYRMSYGANCTAQAAGDGRSMRDLQLWLDKLKNNDLPYRLRPAEARRFKWGIYQLEMHFAGMAAYYNQENMQKTYTAFAEQFLPERPPAQEIEQMRRVYINLHQGIFAFRDYKLKEARRYFLRAIRIGPTYCKPLWIWSKLLLTFVGKTKWGILYR